MPDPIIKEITVPLDKDRAFRLFTEEMADWWPLESHSMSAQEGGTPANSVDVPSEVGQQVIETKPDGSTAPWGRVTEYEPGSAYGMSWHVGRAEAEATHVRVTFTTVADGTRVQLIHSDWPEGATAMHQMYASGWDMVLGQRFGAACQAARVHA